MNIKIIVIISLLGFQICCCQWAWLNAQETGVDLLIRRCCGILPTPKMETMFNFNLNATISNHSSFHVFSLVATISVWYILGKRLHRYLFPAQKIYDTDFIGCLGRCLWFLGNIYYYISLLPKVIFHWLPGAIFILFHCCLAIFHCCLAIFHWLPGAMFIIFHCYLVTFHWLPGAIFIMSLLP